MACANGVVGPKHLLQNNELEKVCRVAHCVSHSALRGVSYRFVRRRFGNVL